MSAVPRLVIDFNPPNETSFVIEELTFNPYIPVHSIYKDNSVDIWMEFSIKRTDNDHLAKEVPQLRLRYFGDSNDIFFPSTQIPRELTGIDNAGDINFLMYSDIWYSFVRLEGQDREFMTSGYKTPVRVISRLSPNQAPNSAPDLKEKWITAGYQVFRRGKYQKDANDLRRRIMKFHQYLHSYPNPEGGGWEKEAPPEIDGHHEVWIPSTRDEFAPVNFEFTIEHLAGRFAVRRKPWHDDASSKYFGIGYGGSADVDRKDKTEYAISPKLFDVKDSRRIPAKLSKGESVRFWLYFKSRSCLFSSGRRFDRLGFAFQIEAKPFVYSYNSFFRQPLKI